jgi:hypothetical protein
MRVPNEPKDPISSNAHVCQTNPGTSILLALLIVLAVPTYAAYPNGYNNCKVVTTLHTMVSGSSDLANYPLTVKLTDPDLKTTANGGLVNNSSGYDIGFYPDCSGSGTPLKWEMESYSATTGAIVAHVLRPVLSHAADDTIGMYFGSSFSTFQSTAASVWDAGYKGVYHLPNGSALSVNDSTANGANGTNNGLTAASGQVDGAAAANGTSYADLGNPSALQITGKITVSAWINVATFPTVAGTEPYGIAAIVDKGADPSAGWADGYFFRLYNPGIMEFDIGSYDGTNVFETTWAVSGWSTGTWHYLVGLYNGTAWQIYFDGALKASTNSGTGARTSAKNVYLAAQYYSNGQPPGRLFNGAVDEVRISNTARSPDWILTEYRNQSAPDTYLSVGPRLSASISRVRHSVKTDQ